MQLNLTFLEIPNPSALVWETLNEEQRADAVGVLARLIAQAAKPEPNVEDNNDD